MDVQDPHPAPLDNEMTGEKPVGRYVPHEHLLKYDRSIKKRGKQLIIAYAGEDPVRIVVSYLSGRAARESAHALMADLRRARTDDAYNNILDDFKRAIKAAQIDREDMATGELVDVPCPKCGTMLTLAPVFAEKAADLCVTCNGVNE